MTVAVHDDRVCALGEGPLWHPLREQLFWFDILGRRMLSRGAEGPLEWRFDGHVSSAGWIDHDTLLIASDGALMRFDIATGLSEDLVTLEADNAVTRSNDGRADPHGGFWIGTMGREGETEAGAIYRFLDGTLTRLFGGVTIPNAICFAPGGGHACFADTARQRVMRIALDGRGWPRGTPEVFLDLRAEGYFPDGAVFDAEGALWVAKWGASRVSRYAPDGALLATVDVPARHVTCPSFGGPDLRTLFVTSASVESRDGKAGMTFAARMAWAGQPEHRVHLKRGS